MFSIFGGYATSEETIPIKESRVPPEQLVLNEVGQYFGMRRFHVGIITSGILLGLVPGILNGASPYIVDSVAEEFGVGDAAASLVSTSILGGSILGVIVTSRWSDMIGRKRVLMLLTAIAVLGCQLHFFIPHSDYGFVMLVILRALLGIPYGGLIIIVVPYVLEFCGDDIRGLAGTSLNLSFAAAAFLAICGVQIVGIDNWRRCLALVPVIPCFVAFVFLGLMPESPRWLFVAGRKKEGQKVVDSVFESRPIIGWAYVGKAPTVIVEKMESKDTSVEAYHELFSPELRSTTIVAIVLYFCLATGSNTMFTWGPTIVNQVAGQEVGLWVFKAQQFVSITGTFIAMYLLDRAGRRFTLAVAYFCCSLVCVCLALASLLQSYHTPLVGALWLINALSGDVLWASLCAYLAEAFPTVLRSTGSGFAALGGRIGSVVVPFALGPLVHHQVVFALCIMAWLAVIGAAWSLKIPKEMACKAMEDGYGYPGGSWSTL